MLSFIFSEHTSQEWFTISNEKLFQTGLADWEKSLWRFIADWYSDSPFVTLRTSGSTGTPKLIEVSKEMMCVSARKTLQFLNIKPNNTALLCLSADYIAGKMMIVRSILGNLRLFAVAPSGKPLMDFSRFVDFSAMVPMQVFQQLKEVDSLNRIGKLLVGGGAVSSQLSESLQVCSCMAYESYGMTETVSHIALRRINGNERQEGFVPMNNVSVSLDERGCLLIDAPDLLTKSLQTNDSAEILPSGEFRILGRIDNVINSGGIKIQPEEIERQITPFFTRNFVISCVTDDKLGEKLVLVSEESLNPEQIQLINSNLNPYQHIRSYLQLSPFPQTTTHKIDRPAVKRFVSEHLETPLNDIFH